MTAWHYLMRSSTMTPSSVERGSPVDQLPVRVRAIATMTPSGVEHRGSIVSAYKPIRPGSDRDDDAFGR